MFIFTIFYDRVIIIDEFLAIDYEITFYSINRLRMSMVIID